MNYVATALRHEGDLVAVIAEGEEGTVRTLTYRELSDQVASFASGLRSLGVKRGDRVAVFLPLTVECAVAVLAIGAIGAVLIPIFSGYGAEAIAGRLRDGGRRG
jgi:acetyl-CoA synthetase